jgi:hypothetical protein
MKTDEISLNELIQKSRGVLGFLKTKWLKLLLFIFLGGISGFFFAKFYKADYTANLTFALVEGGEKMGGLSSIASQVGLDLFGTSGGAFSGDNLLELMKSRLLIENTLLSPVDSFGKSKLLVNQYIDFMKPNQPKKRGLTDPIPVTFDEAKIGKGNFTFFQDSFLNKICKDISKKNLKVVKLEKKLALVSVKYTGKDEWFAKNFIQVLTRNVTDFYIETKTRQIRKNVIMMEHKVDSVRNLLGLAVLAVASEMDGNHFLINGVAKVPQAKKQLEIQVLTLAYGELLKNLEIQRAIMSKDQPLIQIIDQPRFPLEKFKITKIQGCFLGMFFFLFLGIVFLLVMRSINN